MNTAMGMTVIQFEKRADYIEALFTLSPALGLKIRQLGDWKLYVPADALPELGELQFKETSPIWKK